MMQRLDRIRLVQGNIVDQNVDAIVNAANTSLLGGGGVDGAIHRAAGPGLLEECRAIGGCPTGEARITGGHDLGARHVIHTVGPVYGGGTRGEPDLLASAYRSSLQLATANACRTVAFPSISTGAYRYPIREAARIALRTTLSWLDANGLPERVFFILFSPPDLEVYEAALQELERGE